MRVTAVSLLAVIASTILLPGCGKRQEESQKGPPPAMITVAKVESRAIQVVEESVGQVDTETAPMIAVEVPGRIAKIHVDVGDAVRAGQVLAELDPRDQKIGQQAAAAEVARLQALLRDQEANHRRNLELAQKNFISKAALDSSEAQLHATREQLKAAQAHYEASTRGVSKTRIVAPVAGRIDQRKVSVGDVLEVGMPVFRLATTKSLRIHLPFPEGVAPRLKAGQPVQLATPTAPDKKVTARVSEIRPMVGTTNRAVEAIVDLDNPGDWTPGASVNGSVVVAERPDALIVPEQSVVLRPAGEVVYIVKDGKVQQRVVRTGVRQHGYVEILDGLKEGETVAKDGAGYLTDRAVVVVQGGTRKEKG